MVRDGSNGFLDGTLFYCYNYYRYNIIMITDPQEEIFEDIAKSLKRIADALEKKWHIDIDHGHIESIDNIEHGDIDTHQKKF